MTKYQQYLCCVNEQPVGKMWSAIEYDLHNIGFKWWQIRLYGLIYHRWFYYNRIKSIIKRVLKYLYWLVILFGCVIFWAHVCGLMKAVKVRNEMQAIESTVHACQMMPKSCKNIADIYKNLEDF